MSFLEKIAGSPHSQREAATEGHLPSLLPDNPMERTMRLGPGSLLPDSALPREDSSIISEAAPSELAGEFGESRLAEDLDDSPASGLPLVGHWSTARQQRLLLALFGVGLVVLILVAVAALTGANRSSAQASAAAQAQTQSQRLAKSVSQALLGSTPAFVEVKESADVLVRNVRSLATGEGDVAAVGGALQDEVQALLPMVARAEKSAGALVAQQKTLTQVGEALRDINSRSGELLELAQSVSALKLQQGAPAAEIAAVGQLEMLTQRIAKSANEFQTVDGVGPEAVSQLGKDLDAFRATVDGLLGGSSELRLTSTQDPQQRERLRQLLKAYEDTRAQAGAILGNLQGLVAAREAQSTIVNDSEPLRRALGALEGALAEGGGVGPWSLLAALAAVALMLVGGLGLLRLFVVDQTARSRLAEAQRLEAERQEHEAKRVNDANQAAILRLMNELQTVA
ncbi:MAG TPA: type IV pili methyl-accepting chemotaxis transducer N-terminal domain-containing protein, partial [Rubrivivax sp.]|nr:type IV pili methyl-accepting chemotaxis transducer N-terminal domain-containing protein [Rubrivivax sp.]